MLQLETKKCNATKMFSSENLKYYSEATKKSPRDSGDAGTHGFPLSDCCCISLQRPLAHVKKSKALIGSEAYHMVINIHIKE
jgi:hypothetical protein